MIFHQPFNSQTNYNFNAVFYTDEIWNYHFHRNLELIWVLSGSVRCTVNNTAYLLGEGDFGLCLPYDVHKYEPSPHTQYWVLVFSEDFVRSFANQIGGKTGEGFRFRCHHTIKAYVTERLLHNDSPSIFTLKSCLYGLCEEYLNSVRLADTKKKDAEGFARILGYIAANYAEKISLAEVAKELGYDYNYMSRFFRNKFNMTFSELVNVYRAESAIRLLEDTDKSITEIAYESGFHSLRSFNGFFKSQMGITPTQYRKEHPSGLIKAAKIPPNTRATRGVENEYKEK
ncbi:MAG: helix-turn-helix transcriptional regulator [Clostridia bacterium]|nr:helix-turn-helix transcriptional regulator [Clostridia bacterium]